jgi:hypothetical protein
MSPPKSFFEEFEVIHTYSRKQAIADGVLVDMTQAKFGELLREAGCIQHAAMTSAAFDRVISLGQQTSIGQDAFDRWWNVLVVMKNAILDALHNSPMSMGVERVPFTVRIRQGAQQGIVKLYVHCGPGDEAEPLPVLTIMLEGED